MCQNVPASSYVSSIFYATRPADIDRNFSIYESLSEIEAGAKRLAQVVLGASHLAQTAVPALLSPSSTEHVSAILQWKTFIRNTLQDQAECLCDALSKIGPCLQVIPPQGAMYAMVRIHMEYFNSKSSSIIQTDLDFTKLLLAEENVMVLPGSCFGVTNSFRVVFCAPVPILEEAASRILKFCQRHCTNPKQQAVFA